MKALAFAMEKEKQAEQLYRDLEAKTGDPGFSSIFGLLAEQEVKHFEALKQMQAEAPELTKIDTNVLPRARDIFSKMKSAVKNFDFDVSHVDLYKKAQQVEQESRDFYLEKADEIENPKGKDLFLALAEEEKKHYFLLDNIIEFVNRPQQWLEDAEWHHLEQY